jgi:hypothetical protein
MCVPDKPRRTCFEVYAAPLEHGSAYLRALGVQHGGHMMRALVSNHLTTAADAVKLWSNMTKLWSNMV